MPLDQTLDRVTLLRVENYEKDILKSCFLVSGSVRKGAALSVCLFVCMCLKLHLNEEKGRERKA